MRINKKQFIIGKLLIIGLIIGLSSCSQTNHTDKYAIKFVPILGNGSDIGVFQMAETEVTNQQYVDFLGSSSK
jgi:hypothetical protein